MERERFSTFVERNIQRTKTNIKIAESHEIDSETIGLIKELEKELLSIQKLNNKSELSIHYLNQFQTDISRIVQHLPFGNNEEITERRKKEQIQIAFRTQEDGISRNLEFLKFNLYIFTKLGFFSNNIVLIGANGCGKTTLINTIKKYMSDNMIAISAQRILLVPTITSLHNKATTSQQLKSIQTVDKTNKDPDHYKNLEIEFSVVLKNLLADNFLTSNSYRSKSAEQAKRGEDISPPPITRLDKTIEIWNFIIESLRLECIDGMNISAISPTGEKYHAIQLSEGEKVALFLIAQILQAPTSGFIIIDEPEMYLHKTILKKLWDRLEFERKDCKFIYLTHDLDFAVSRTTAKKIWIRSFNFPNSWEFENIPENNLPESLLLELLGSKRTILFCEGEKGSIDEKIYNILFPKYTITPVGGCSSVINYTKAFNKISNVTTKAIGLIDSDHQNEDRLQKLRIDHIYSFSMCEPENLLLDEDFLSLLGEQLLKKNITEKIKAEILTCLKSEIDLQVSNYVSTRINYYFKESHVSKGNNLETVTTNYKNFSDEIKIDEWYNTRKAELLKIIKEQNYRELLSRFNNKGLKKIANQHLGITDFTERAISFIQFNPTSHNSLRKYFPKEIIEGM